MSQKPKKSSNSIAELEHENSMLRAEIDDLKLKLEHMNEILMNMQRARFEQSSEKQKYVSPDQLSVFNEAETEQDPKVPEPDEKTIIVPEHKRKPKKSLEDKNQRNRFLFPTKRDRKLYAVERGNGRIHRKQDERQIIKDCA
nr:hypothetical protein [uncultured Ruminococcus sp.]